MRRCIALCMRSGGPQKASGPFDPYKILGVPPTATTDEIKKAYHKLALRFHPDSGPQGSKERFQAVQEAYDAVKSGTWVPTDNANPDGESEHRQGGPRTGTYAYEAPGSTSDNYVSSNPSLQRNLQIFMVSCFAIVVVRMWYFFAFRPPKPTAAVQQEQPSIDGVMNDAAGGGRDRSVSIHDEDDKEWRRAKERERTTSGGATVFNFMDDKKA